jgi:hypothetical protein
VKHDECLSQQFYFTTCEGNKKMKTLINYLDDLKEKSGSDYKAAKMLKTNQSTIGMIRTRNKCGDETAIKIADLLGVERDEVLIAAAIARSQGEVKAAWENVYKHIGTAATVMMIALLNLTDTRVTDNSLNFSSGISNVYYVKLMTTQHLYRYPLATIIHHQI